VRDFEEKKTDAPQDAPLRVLKPKGNAQAEGRDTSHVSQQEAAGLSAPELSHPANAAPLADMLTHLQQSHGNNYVQRVVADMNDARSSAEPQQHVETQSLDPGVRSEMESAFGESFDDVRIHTDGQAEEVNDELGARAFTRGRDVYFGRNEYQPSTREGRELLAHELTHVVQQGGSPSVQQTRPIDQRSDRFEEEADHAARAVLTGGPASVLHRSAAPSLQCQPRAGGPAQQIPGAIDLNHDLHGGLSGGATYAYDASSRQLTLTGPPPMSVSSVDGGQIAFDSRKETLPAARTQTVIIRVTGNPLSILVNGTRFRFAR
jgi:Domain of unknown function (DUF4157)